MGVASKFFEPNPSYFPKVTNCWMYIQMMMFDISAGLIKPFRVLCQGVEESMPCLTLYTTKA